MTTSIVGEGPEAERALTFLLDTHRGPEPHKVMLGSPKLSWSKKTGRDFAGPFETQRQTVLHTPWVVGETQTLKAGEDADVPFPSLFWCEPGNALSLGPG